VQADSKERRNDPSADGSRPYGEPGLGGAACPGPGYGRPNSRNRDINHKRALKDRLAPFRVRRESDGFIFNRIWAAIKRECLMVVEEGVAGPEDVDEMWTIHPAGHPALPAHGPRRPPRRARHRGALRGRASRTPGQPRTLLQQCVDEGRLGVKSGRGFYDDAN
jgi:3-hydroxyacyl-CoA dehydrogenase